MCKTNDVYEKDLKDKWYIDEMMDGTNDTWCVSKMVYRTNYVQENYVQDK